MRLKSTHAGNLVASWLFYGLVAISFVLLVSLTGFTSYFWPAYNTCRSMWDNLLVRLAVPGVLIPLIIAGTMATFTLAALYRQWQVTRRFLNKVIADTVPCPNRLKHMAAEVGLDDRIECVSHSFVAPFCYGLTHPRVVISLSILDVLDDDELRAVLSHEKYHVERLDPLKIWISRALARGMYFLPLAGAMRDNGRLTGRKPEFYDPIAFTTSMSDVMYPTA